MLISILLAIVFTVVAIYIESLRNLLAYVALTFAIVSLVYIYKYAMSKKIGIEGTDKS